MKALEKVPISGKGKNSALTSLIYGLYNILKVTSIDIFLKIIQNAFLLIGIQSEILRSSQKVVHSVIGSEFSIYIKWSTAYVLVY